MLSQINRAAKLFTPLGPDALCLVDVSVRESLGNLFLCEIHAISQDADIDFDKLIGQACHVELDRGPSGKRIVHGVVAEGEWLGLDHGLTHYRLVLRPWFWLLDKIADCRIFHEKTVLDIVRETFGRRGFADFRVATTHDYPVLHYTVQYRETDFNFLSRLMEQHGIYYYFEHAADRHVLVLCDGRASHSSAPGLENVVYVTAKDAGHLLRRPTIQAWRMRRALRSGRAGLQDFNHLTPNTQMLADAAATEKYSHSALELYDYPGPHVVQSDGERYARVRLEAEQALDKRRSAIGYAVSAFAGAFLTLSRHPRGGENGQYLLVGTRFSFGPQSYRAHAGEEEASYRGEYDLLPVDVPFRAPMATPKPRIDSVQTAIVVGQKGEEIDCDDHGRILVHFHWDRHGDQSCRLRVAQVWGGQSWGGQIIPRIGMEVSVVYLEGDPDRPLVTGCVPDPVNHRVPYDLPANKTRSVLRSNTYKGTGFNEFTIEDKTGGEIMFFHAQKDHTTRVLNNRTARVDSHDVYSVGGNRAVEVAKNQKHEIGGSLNMVVGGTGSSAMKALTGVMGLAGQTANLLKQSGDIAGGGGPALGAFGLTLASSALGFLSGGGQKARKGVVSGPDPRADAGVDLTASGTGIGKDAGGFFPLPGIMNTVVQSFQSTSVGVAQVEQIGMSKVTNVGQTQVTNVGKFSKTIVGEEFVIECGASKFIMRKDGTVIILGTNFNFTASGPTQINGKVVDLNKPGGGASEAKATSADSAAKG